MQVSPSAIDANKNDSSVASANDQYVRVRLGKLELAMSTEHLAGVHQVSRQNRLTDNNTVLTAKGEYPLVKLGSVLGQQIDMPAGETPGRALIAVESGEKTRMILVDSVSRPAKVRIEHVHPFPKIALKDDVNLIRSMINICLLYTSPSPRD